MKFIKLPSEIVLNDLWINSIDVEAGEVHMETRCGCDLVMLSEKDMLTLTQEISYDLSNPFILIDREIERREALKE